MDCGIDQDHSDCVQAILSHDSWKNALRNAYIDPISGCSEQRLIFKKKWIEKYHHKLSFIPGNVVTPVRKLVVKMPEMAEFAFSRSIKDNGKKWDDQRLEVQS